MKTKQALKLASRVLGGLLAFIILYLFSAFVLSHITVPREIIYARMSFPVFILTDGIHTDLVVPVKSEVTDWTTRIKISHDTSVKYVAFGWGDKNFYINTPTWAELKFSTAFQAVFGFGTSAIHTAFYKTIEPGPDCKMIMLNVGQYARLVGYIKSSFKLDGTGNFINIKTNMVYDNDAFFDAKGRYSLFFTCNTWANNALKSCGQKACLWTVFADGIAYQYRDR